PVETREASLGELSGVLREALQGQTIAPQVLDDAFAGRLPEHEKVEERIGPQSICAVHGNARALAHGIESRDHGLRIAVLRYYYLPVVIGRDTTHLIVAGRHDRNRISHRIHVGELERDLAYSGQALV